MHHRKESEVLPVASSVTSFVGTNVIARGVRLTAERE